MRARIAAVGAVTILSCSWLATPALATDGYPPSRPSGTVQSTTDVQGVNEQSGLPHTGGSLEPLVAGLALLGAGGVVVAATRRRSRSSS